MTSRTWLLAALSCSIVAMKADTEKRPDPTDPYFKQQENNAEESFTPQKEELKPKEVEEEPITSRTNFINKDKVTQDPKVALYEAIHTKNNPQRNKIIEHYGRGPLKGAISYSALQRDNDTSIEIIDQDEFLESYKKFLLPTKKILMGALGVGASIFVAGIYCGYRLGKMVWNKTIDE
jgi:hypothetical protein